MMTLSEKKEIRSMLIFTLSISMLFLFVPVIASKLFIVLNLLALIIGFVSTKYGLIIIIISYTSIFSLYHPNYDLAGNFTDLGLAVLLGGMIRYLIEKFIRKKMYVSMSTFKNIVVFFSIVILMSLSIFIAYYRFGQPMIRGLLTFRIYLILLYVFPLIEYFKRNNNILIVLKYLEIVVIYISIIFIFQYLLMDYIIIFPVSLRYRSNEWRILMHEVSPLICLIFGCFLNKLIYLKNDINETVKNIMKMIILIVPLFFVAKTRIYILVVLVLTYLLGIIINKKINKKIKITTLIISIVMVFSFLISPLGKNLINSTFSDVIVQGEDYVRSRAINYYFSFIEKDNFILGGGITNEKYEESPVINGNEEGLYLVDIGIYGYFFEFGIMGVIALLILFFSMFKLIQKCNNYIYVNVGVSSICILAITMFTVVPFSYSLMPIIIVPFSILIGQIYGIKTVNMKNNFL